MDILKKVNRIMEAKIILVASFIILLMFVFPYSKNALIIGSVLGIGVICFTIVFSRRCKENDYKTKEISSKELIASLICLVYLGICFYERYKDFGTWEKIGNIINCPAVIILAGVTIGLAVGAFPIILFFCRRALSDEERKNSKGIETEPFLKISKAIVYVGIGCMILFCFSKYLWIDESFSLSLIDHDYKTLIELAAKDVHPPLYYIILKFVVDLTFKIFPFSYTRIYFAKLVSVIPYIVLLIIGEKYINRKYGRYVAAFFEVMIIGMSNFTNYSVEIRMYSMALLFVTISFLSYIEIIEKDGKDAKNWVIFASSSILAAYTHYYACIAVAFLYIILFINLIYKRKNIWAWVITSGITVVAYLPWLGILLSQFSKVSGGYWIEPISFSAIWQYTVFTLGAYNVFPIILVGIINYLENKDKYSNIEKCIIGTGLLMPLWVAGVGLTVSFLIRPVFVARYMFAAFGAFWLAVILINSKNSNKKAFLCINWLLMIFAMINISVFIMNETKDWKNADKIYEAVNVMEEDSAIYSNSQQGALFISLITGKKVNTVQVFSDYEDQIYKNHVMEIADVKDIEESLTYCFWLKGSDTEGIEFEKELGDFFEEKAFTLYLYKKDGE